MTCSECWTSAPAGAKTCPRCGAKLTGAPPSFSGLLKAYPWLAALLAASLMVTVWAATRRAPPPPEPIAPAVEPVTAAPVPAPEPETISMPTPMPEPEPAPPAPAPVQRAAQEDQPPPPPSSEAVQQLDGTWRSGSATGGR